MSRDILEELTFKLKNKEKCLFFLILVVGSSNVHDHQISEIVVPKKPSVCLVAQGQCPTVFSLLQIDYQVQQVATEKWANYSRCHKCQLTWKTKLYHISYHVFHD